MYNIKQVNDGKEDFKLYNSKVIKLKNPQEWIEEHLAEIQDMPNSESEISSWKRAKAGIVLEEGTKYSISFNKRDFDRWAQGLRFPTFQKVLLEGIKDREMSNVKFYRKAHIDRKLFSAIKKDPLYKPSKKTVLACCLALELDVRSTEDMLKTAGYTFVLWNMWDKAVYYCFDNDIFDIDDVNDILYSLGSNNLF